MTTKVLIGIILITASGVVHSQHFYIKPQVRYHTTVTNQEAPEFFNAAIIVNTSTGSYYTYIITQIKNFSLSDGISYGGTLGYTFNKKMGVEIGLNYFQSKNDIICDSIGQKYPVGSTAWQFRTLNAAPSVVLENELGKISLSARAGIIIGLSSLGKSIIFEDKRKTYKFNPGFSFGYTFGLEFSYPIAPHLSVSLESGIENLFYKPRKALLKQDDFTYWAIDELPVFLREIRYVNEIDHERVYYELESDTYYTDRNRPLLRLKETIKLNSFNIGIGLKYTFGTHE